MVLSQQFAWVCISQSPRVFGFWVGFVWLVCVWVFRFVVGGFFLVGFLGSFLRKRVLEVRLLN